MSQPGKTMFEIYRDAHNREKVGVVYFTELEEHERDRVLARIAGATSLYRGFLRDDRKAEAKEAIDAVLAAYASGEDPPPEAIAAKLRPYLVDP